MNPISLFSWSLFGLLKMRRNKNKQSLIKERSNKKSLIKKRNKNKRATP
jgi:hypothetical protein